MNNDKGELTKKAELLEIEFLQEMGVDTLGKYPDVEKHIDKITDVLIGENEDVEEMVLESEELSSAIDSASYDLEKMKKVVDRIEDSDLKITLLSCIQDMVSDLNV